MSGRTVSDLATGALRERSASAVVGTLVAAARSCAAEEARGDVRDGLIDMPLAFDAAARLGLDADALVEQALALLDGRAADLLAEFAARPDRDEIGGMAWSLEPDGDGAAVYRWRG